MLCDEVDVIGVPQIFDPAMILWRLHLMSGDLYHVEFNEIFKKFGDSFLL